MRLLSYILFFLLALLSCITEYQPDTKSIPRGLVVEGAISDAPGPYTVRLTHTTEYTNASLNLLEVGAQVSITDDLGKIEFLRETVYGSGTYRTQANGIRGVAGRRYTLRIVTTDGKRYESSAELLTAAPPINRLYAEYRADPTALTNDAIQGWDVYIDTQDPARLGDFYRWEWTHYEATEICAVNYSINESIACCTPCWDIARCYDCVNIQSDANINGNVLSRRLILRVPYTSRSPYYVEVKQQRLSAGGYAFWQSVKGLTQNNGGLFDAAPSLVQGNLRCTSDPTALVFGYFGATGLSEGYLYVDRSNAQGLPVSPPVLPIGIFGCATCADNLYRTPNAPRWWR